jgi:hypothetical protein
MDLPGDARGSPTCPSAAAEDKGGASTKAGGENDAKDRLNKASPADPRSGRQGLDHGAHQPMVSTPYRSRTGPHVQKRTMSVSDLARAKGVITKGGGR